MCLSDCDARLRIVGCMFIKGFCIVRIATHPVLRKGCVEVAVMLDSGLWAVGLSHVICIVRIATHPVLRKGCV